MSPVAADTLPMLATAGWALGSSGLVVTAVEKLRRRRLADSVLWERWRTWVRIAPLWIAAAAWAPAALVLLAFLGWMAAREYVRLAGVGGVAARSFVAWAAAAPLLAAYAPEVWLWSVPVFVVAVSLVTPAGSERADALPRLALGACYLPFLIPLLWFVRAADPVHWFAIGFAVALADVAAYVAGRMLGGRRLAPTLSPNKTWSGVAGAALGAAAGLGVAAVIFETGYGVGPALLIALPVTAAAVWGDLFESGLKRAAGVKDAGTLLPGFGGVLDRIDSLLFSAPAYLACLHLIGWVS